MDSQPKTQRSGREKTKCKHTVSNPNYSTGLGWKWGKRGESSPFYRGNPKFPPPMAARCAAIGLRGRGHASARTLLRVRAGPWPRDACPRASARTRLLQRPRVTADAGGRPDDVRRRPDGHFNPKMSVMTSLASARTGKK
jgi:hypothetical protein